MTSATSDAARPGDLHSFETLIAPHRGELHRHCYRMLGSLDDADEVLQETMMAAWQGMSGYTGSGTLRSWLYTIATRRCLNAIRDGKRRPPPSPVPPFDPPDPDAAHPVRWLQPYPDRLLHDDPGSARVARESIELAFIAALQVLPPRQTAALVLVDVLGFTGAEAAAMVEVSPTAMKGLLQRSRAAIKRSRNRGDRRSDEDVDEELARRFAVAYSADDVDAVVSLLTDDAWLAMPPAPHLYLRPRSIAEFLSASARGRGGRLRLLPTRANQQPAFGCYLGGSGPAIPTGVIVLDTAPDGISGITRFLDNELHRQFDLPDSLAG